MGIVNNNFCSAPPRLCASARNQLCASARNKSCISARTLLCTKKMAGITSDHFNIFSFDQSKA
jgi:hypothetical protein